MRSEGFSAPGRSGRHKSAPTSNKSFWMCFKSCKYSGVRNVQIRHADDGIRFVDAAVSRHAQMEFRQSRPVPERSLPFIARSRVDFVEFHFLHRFRERVIPRIVVCMKTGNFPTSPVHAEAIMQASARNRCNRNVARSHPIICPPEESLLTCTTPNSVQSHFQEIEMKNLFGYCARVPAYLQFPHPRRRIAAACAVLAGATFLRMARRRIQGPLRRRGLLHLHSNRARPRNNRAGLRSNRARPSGTSSFLQR